MSQFCEFSDISSEYVPLCKKEASRELKLDHQKGRNTADKYKGQSGFD